MTSLESTPPLDSPTVNRNGERQRGHRPPRRRGQSSLARRPRGGANPASSTAVSIEDPAIQEQQSTGATLTLRPASLAPISQNATADPSSNETSEARNGAVNNSGTGQGRNRGKDGSRYRGGYRGRGGRANGSNAVPSTRDTDEGATHEPESDLHHGRRVATRRPFGGHLTTSIHRPSTSSNNSRLQPDAPEFYPGQQQARIAHPYGHKTMDGNEGPKKATTPRARRDSNLKSTAPDIATRTHEDISNGLYECPICTSEVTRTSKIWSCKTCWTVFHLTCIKKWSTNEGSTLNQQQNADGEIPPPRQWRCPGCNLPKDILPSSYTCWCEKEIDPRYISGLPPHSCGQTCGKSRILPKKCPHPCDLLCHAGPCPPCPHNGPSQSCFCGKKITSRRCLDTNYDTGWSCGEICGDLMPCGQHTCQKPCHEGLCGACEIQMESRCYCGKVEKPVLCCDRGDEKESLKGLLDRDGSESWVGSFDCGNPCSRAFDCGKHTCKRNCHPQDLISTHCPYSPDRVMRCPCGKSLLSQISDEARVSCQDPIPSCEKKCQKRLPCGHFCHQTCHADDCMLCLLTVPILCRCGRVQSSTICHQGSEERPQCMRACKATLNCGRHECGERCCPGERKAAERQATKRKLRPLGAPRLLDVEVEAEHICTRLCGRLLKCGTHSCTELCHKGPCGSCREAIFDEVSCHCGRTVLQPPLPCGTKPPPCRFECERPKICGHPRVPHNCHGDEEACPKCPFLMEKPCMCGKRMLKNQPCWLTDARCGEVCGKKLKCGSHFCRKPCHRPGECEDVGKSCQQACGKPKRTCGHPCDEPCHAPSSCREDKPCPNKILATCECQHLKQEMKCNASKSSDGNLRKSLNCDEECARLERNRNLALALDIDPETHKNDHVPYSTETLRYFHENTQWSQAQEKTLRLFAADENEKRLRFKPMPAAQRSFLHSLSEDFGFDSESMDPEPHRHVAVFKTPRFVMAPMKTMADCVRIRMTVEATMAKPALPATKASSSSSSNNEPFNTFLLVHPRFGLTVDELRSDLAPTLRSAPAGIDFDISFLPSEEIVLKARPASSGTNIPASSLENTVKALKAALATATAQKRLAASVQLCALDASLNILRRESDSAAAAGGWSRVAARGAAPRMASRQVGVGGKSGFAVLGSKVKDAARKKKEEEEMERKKVEEEVVEDWEEEVRREEAKEGGILDGGNPPVESETGDQANRTEGQAEVERAVDWAKEQELAE